jgi:hypothetical protein
MPGIAGVNNALLKGRGEAEAPIRLGNRYKTWRLQSREREGCAPRNLYFLPRRSGARRIFGEAKPPRTPLQRDFATTMALKTNPLT